MEENILVKDPIMHRWSSLQNSEDDRSSLYNSVYLFQD